MLRDLLRARGPGGRSPSAVRSTACARTRNSETAVLTRLDHTTSACTSKSCFRPTSVMVVCNDAHYADRLRLQTPVFYIYGKYLNVIKSTAYHDNAVAEVYFNPIYTNRASVPLHQLHHASLDTDEATDAGGMTRFSHVLPAHGSVWPWTCRRHPHLHQHTSMEK